MSSSPPSCGKLSLGVWECSSHTVLCPPMALEARWGRKTGGPRQPIACWMVCTIVSMQLALASPFRGRDQGLKKESHVSEVRAGVGAPVGLWYWGAPSRCCSGGPPGCSWVCRDLPLLVSARLRAPSLPVATCSRKLIAARDGESFCTPGMLILAPEGLCLGQTVQVSVYAHACVQPKCSQGCTCPRGSS